MQGMPYFLLESQTATPDVSLIVHLRRTNLLVPDAIVFNYRDVSLTQRVGCHAD